MAALTRNRNTTRTCPKVARRLRSAAQNACTSLSDYISRQCTSRQKTAAFLTRIGIRKTSTGDVYVVPV